MFQEKSPPIYIKIKIVYNNARRAFSTILIHKTQAFIFQNARFSKNHRPRDFSTKKAISHVFQKSKTITHEKDFAFKKTQCFFTQNRPRFSYENNRKTTIFTHTRSKTTFSCFSVCVSFSKRKAAFFKENDFCEAEIIFPRLFK